MKQILALIAVALWSVHCGPVDPSEGGRPGADVRRDAGDEPGVDAGSSLPPGVDVTVATLNVELLFDQVCDSRRCGAGQFERARSEGQIDSKVGRIGRALEALDADLVVLQEIETEALLERIADEAPSYRHAFLAESGSPASIDVGVVSRHPFSSIAVERSIDLGSRSVTPARPMAIARATVRGVELAVIGAHLISKRSSSSSEARLREARALGALARREGGAELVVVAGDFNDTPDSAPIGALRDASLHFARDPPDLDRDYTYRYRGERQILDYVMHRAAPGVFVGPDQPVVARDGGATGLAGSDHAGVRVTYRVARVQ